MYVVVEHPCTVWNRADGREEFHAWPPQVVGPLVATAVAAARAARINRAREPDSSFGVAEIIRRPSPGVAVVRDVVRVLGGYGRGPEYEVEYWGD